VVPVAVGGGIAAVAAGGAAVYYFFISSRGAESAAGAAGAAGGGGSVGGRTQEVAVTDEESDEIAKWVVNRPPSQPTLPNRKSWDKMTQQERVESLFNPQGTAQSEYEAELVNQQNRQVEHKESQNTRNKLNEQVEDQLNKTEMEIQQNRTNTQNKIIERMQQELKEESQTTQEVADSGESSNNAET